MSDFIRLLALGAATFSLGIGFALAILFTIASRYSSYSENESCFGKFIILVTLAIATFFFYVAIMA